MSFCNDNDLYFGTFSRITIKPRKCYLSYYLHFLQHRKSYLELTCVFNQFLFFLTFIRLEYSNTRLTTSCISVEYFSLTNIYDSKSNKVINESNILRSRLPKFLIEFLNIWLADKVFGTLFPKRKFVLKENCTFRLICRF